MNRQQALQYISYALDDAGAVRQLSDMPENARLVGWQCGFEPLFVAVWSYLDCALDDDEAEDIAAEYLDEIRWFANGRTAADFII